LLLNFSSEIHIYTVKLWRIRSIVLRVFWEASLLGGSLLGNTFINM
jgi:lipid-A-disaccharide synthase-like uncharacterized protein